MSGPDGRTRHYGEFYGVDDFSGGHDGRPLLIVLGNCQAEALRIVIESVPGCPFRTIRIPPVHEMSAADARLLHDLAGRAQVLVAQPIRSGYRSLPIGTNDVARYLPTGPRIVRWPVIRYAGLFPFQAIVRHPSDPSAVPDAVPYHDLRTVRAWCRGIPPNDEWDSPVADDRFRAVADASITELARREKRDCDVAVSDTLIGFGADAAHTINHPGNDVIRTLAQRVLALLGVPALIPTVDRTLLGSVIAPLEQRVLTALGISGEPRAQWHTDGTELTADDVHRAHMLWYDKHPEFVTAALERHRETMHILGLDAAVRS